MRHTEIFISIYPFYDATCVKIFIVLYIKTANNIFATNIINVWISIDLYIYGSMDRIGY